MIHRGKPPKCNIIYKDADRYITLNDNDPDLDPIRIRLPQPPPYYLIDGYGLPHEEQYFRRLEIPDRLLDIERIAKDRMRAREKANKNYKATAERIINAFWEVFEQRREHGYDKVVEWIKEVHWNRVHGYWFFNDGKPTYITGDHFDYLNFWTFPDEADRDGGYPEYRDIDRKIDIFREYAKNTTENVTLDDSGAPVVIDTRTTLCFGTAEPKSRRCGITTQTIHKGLRVAMSGRGKYFTIISMEGDNAEKHYVKKLVPAFKNYPLWLKPIHKNMITTSLPFSSTTPTLDEDSLGSLVDFADSAGERKNDGDKINFILCDEEGKTTQAQILERWRVNKQAMALGERIVGFSIHPTTVEEMDIGGQEYMDMCNQSKFYERDSLGHTKSGLFEVFVPSFERQEGFIDRFGMSVVETPTKRQIELRPDSDFARLGIGAREYRQKQLDVLVESGRPEDMEAHRSLRRKYPMRYADCWIGSSGDLGFDMDVIDKRLAEIRRNSKVRQGRFEWIRGFGSEVRFVDDPEGPFELSMIPKQELRNRKIREDVVDPITGEYREQWAPTDRYRFTASADSFKAGTSNEAKKMGTHTRQSDGGLAVLWEYDDTIDGDKKKPREWTSHRFVCSYRYRPPSLEEYCEDALKMCVYFGAVMYPERNVGDIDLWFIKVGFGGYLMYDIEPVTGKRAEKAGFASYERKKAELFSATKDYIRYHGHKEEHASYLEEVKGIQGVEQMNRYDRFTAHGGCLLGSKQNYYNRMRENARHVPEDRVKTILDFFNKNF